MGDLNGDMIDDIIFNNAENNVQTRKGRLNVAIFMPMNPQQHEVREPHKNEIAVKAPSK